MAMAIMNRFWSLGAKCTNAFKISLNGAINKQFHTNGMLQIQTSPCLLAEPLKKKKRIDPAILRMREERRKRRLEKSIRRLEKCAQRLKPLDEMEITPKLKRELGTRKREAQPLSIQEMEYRINLHKLWSQYKTRQHVADIKMVNRMVIAQDKALTALREESEELYQEAIKLDSSLIPFKVTGPVCTPPIEGYDPPDGEYIDTTRKWT